MFSYTQRAVKNMVICFQCSKETKAQLEELLQIGAYRDYSEAISLAIANQVLLQKTTGRTALVIDHGEREADAPATQQTTAVSMKPNVDLGVRRVGRDRIDLARYGIPQIFKEHPVRPSGVVAPASSSQETSGDEGISQAKWFFGQHNKLLPAKASCRALANLLVDEDGIEVQEAAKKIAGDACELGAHLLMLDRRHGRTRDEMLSTAFPGHQNPDKGRIRYASQFVVGVTKQGELTGLLVDLRLVNKISPGSAPISLTDAGWKFALMPNPVLDSANDNLSEKLSLEERTFLLNHIADHVPIERSAYRAILTAIRHGHDSPEKLRVAFNVMEKETPKNRLYFATQRAGAISRMSDLVLLRRARIGIRVRYVITDDGAAFLERKSMG